MTLEEDSSPSYEEGKKNCCVLFWICEWMNLFKQWLLSIVFVIFITFKGCLVKRYDAWFFGCFWQSISRDFYFWYLLFTYSHCLWKQRLYLLKFCGVGTSFTMVIALTHRNYFQLCAVVHWLNWFYKILVGWKWLTITYV